MYFVITYFSSSHILSSADVRRYIDSTAMSVIWNKREHIKVLKNTHVYIKANFGKNSNSDCGLSQSIFKCTVHINGHDEHWHYSYSSALIEKWTGGEHYYSAKNTYSLTPKRDFGNLYEINEKKCNKNLKMCVQKYLTQHTAKRIITKHICNRVRRVSRKKEEIALTLF